MVALLRIADDHSEPIHVSLFSRREP